MSGTDSGELRGRGRPASGRNLQRSRLLQAAKELLLDPDGPDLALRHVALRAGVTPALAHYYFGNRDGLMSALIGERVEPAIADLTAATRVRASQPVVALTWLMQRLTSLLAADRFLGRCMLMSVARPQRDQLRALLQALLDDAQSKGVLRNDLPTAYLADTLLGMCLFPFVDGGRTAGMTEQAAALTLQHVALLQDGIVRNQRPRQDSGA